VFIGIESPDPKTLVHTKKKQNTRRNIAESVHTLYRYGMWVTAGFIVGFDTETDSVADAMVDFIEETAIPVAMVSLLTVAANTGLARRLVREGRLVEGFEVMPTGSGGDQCTLGLNFSPLRPPQEILDDYRRIVARVYEPKAFAGRLNRLMSMLDCSGHHYEPAAGDPRLKAGAAQAMLMMKVVSAVPEAKDVFWEQVMSTARTNPKAVRYLLMLMSLYAHLRPFSLEVVEQIGRRIAALEALPLTNERPMNLAALGLPAQIQAVPTA
jgi:hypothetical protein